MPQTYMTTIFIAIATYIFALILIRSAGRKTMSRITFFDFVLGVSLGTVTANIALGPNRTGAILVLIIFVVLTILLDYLHIESFVMKKLIDSEPVILIENGKIIEQNLRRLRVTLEELQMQLRQKNVFNISDVEFAVMETNGKVSVLPKSQKQPLTPSDLGVSTVYRGLTRDIIIDGRIMSENLKDASLDVEWLQRTLMDQGIGDTSEVFYAGLDTAGGLYVSEKRKLRETEGKHGIE